MTWLILNELPNFTTIADQSLQNTTNGYGHTIRVTELLTEQIHKKYLYIFSPPRLGVQSEASHRLQ